MTGIAISHGGQFNRFEWPARWKTADIERMFFRFGATIVLAVLVAMAGVLLEKRTLDLRREITRQYYRTDVMLESYARLRLRTQQLASPQRVIESIEDEVYVEPVHRGSNSSVSPTARKPLTLLHMESAAPHQSGSAQ